MRTKKTRRSCVNAEMSQKAVDSLRTMSGSILNGKCLTAAVAIVSCVAFLCCLKPSSWTAAHPFVAPSSSMTRSWDEAQQLSSVNSQHSNSQHKRSQHRMQTQQSLQTVDDCCRSHAVPHLILQLSLQSTSRVVSRLSSLPAGHCVFLIGSFSLLSPICLALVNGGCHVSTDTIVPKEEIRSLFHRQPFVHITAWEPNPLMIQILKPPTAGTATRGANSAVEAETDVSSSVSSLALLSWTLSSDAAFDAQHEAELPDEQRNLKRLSRQRTHVHGRRKRVEAFHLSPSATASTTHHR
jgi:hypothetical protein